MRYLPNTEQEIATMLEVIGVSSQDDLFATIPRECRRKNPMKLPPAMTEWELNQHMDDLADQVSGTHHNNVFVGAGSYHHHVPASVSYLLGRSEFSTAYTPYQPEISQGTLQAIYEYQSLVTRLLGMDVANASMYDGASGLAEALLMAIRVSRRNKVAVSKAIHPNYRQVVNTYFKPTGYEIIELPYRPDGRSDLAALSDISDLAAIAVQSPNFFGCIEDLESVALKAREDPKTLMVACFTEPLAYGLLKNPGSLGADIACGEGQSFGIPQSFGGPGLGMFAAKKAYVRSMPGRLVGRTVDRDGKGGFVLTLATREQHIRREKATSNICSNQGLCATAAAMYMASLGGTGLRGLATLNYDKSEYLKKRMIQAGLSVPFEAPTFNEFVVKLPAGFEQKYQQLLKKKIVAGLPLAPYYPELAGCHLFCVTETFSKQDMDTLVEEVAA
ncbi:MAG: aminomethyl-transferring glycine dehydrogenase subunit GcvPA [Desulfobacterales bacterium]